MPAVQVLAHMACPPVCACLPALPAPALPALPLPVRRTLRSAHRGMTPAAAVITLSLVGGPSSLEGRVEVEVGGSRGAVCAAGFSTREARVVCKALGLTGGTFFARPRGTATLLVSQLKCTGSESSLGSCKFSASSACPGGMAAGVKCASEWLGPASLGLLLSASIPYPP